MVTVRLAAPFDAERLKRNFYATSSCGICGKASLEHLHAERAAPRRWAGASRAPPWSACRPRCARPRSRSTRTGGLHATGVFDADGRLLVLREDVGRHNAMDKAIGRTCSSTGRCRSRAGS